MPVPCRYPLPVGVWACDFSRDDPNIVFAGLSNGSVCAFDLRVTDKELVTLEPPNGRSPVLAVRHIARSIESARYEDMLLVHKLVLTMQ